MVIVRTTCRNVKKFFVLPHSVVTCFTLFTWTSSTAFWYCCYKGHGFCSLWGRNWSFVHNTDMNAIEIQNFHIFIFTFCIREHSAPHHFIFITSKPFALPPACLRQKDERSQPWKLQNSKFSISSPVIMILCLLLNACLIFFRRFRKISKSECQHSHVCPSVRPSVHPSPWNNSAPPGWIFMKFHIWVLFENPSRKFKFH